MNEMTDRSAWEAWRRSQIEKTGNNPDSWVAISRNLVVSGSVLASIENDAMQIMLRNVTRGGAATDTAWTPEEEALVKRGHQTHTTTLMLFGFAVECLLKATFLANGGVLYREGRYRAPRMDRSHNLLEIAQKLGCADLFTAEQLDLLDLLSARNEMGRYPAHTRFDDYGLQMLVDGQEFARFYGIWSPRQSEQVCEILELLYRNLNAEIPPGVEELRRQQQVVTAAYARPSG